MGLVNISMYSSIILIILLYIYHVWRNTGVSLGSTNYTKHDVLVNVRSNNYCFWSDYGRTDIKLLSLSCYGLGPVRYVPILVSLWRILEVGVANPCCSAPSNCSCEPTLSRGRENAFEMTSRISSAGLAGSRWWRTSCSSTGVISLQTILESLC